MRAVWCTCSYCYLTDLIDPNVINVTTKWQLLHHTTVTYVMKFIKIYVKLEDHHTVNEVCIWKLIPENFCENLGS